MIKKLLYLNLFLLFFFPRLLHANLQFVDLENIDWQSGTGYNPFSNKTSTYKVSFDVYNDSNSNQNCFVTISKGNNNSSIYTRISSGTISDDTLIYQIYNAKNEDPNNIIKEIPDLNSNTNVLNGKIKKNKSKSLNLFITVPKDQIVDSDSYSDSLDFKLYSGDYTNSPSEDSLMDSKTINLNIDVQSFLYLDSSVGDIGNQMYIDLGEIEPGTQSDFIILVVASSGYQLSARSENSQKLVHENNIQSIEYELKVQKEKKDLSDGTEVVVFSNKKSTTGKKIKFNFTVSDFNILAAGDYSDLIYVTLTEN